MKLARATALLLAAGAALPGAAHAQAFGPLLGTEIPFDTTRGTNTGVIDRKRPEVDPLGIRAGSFLIYPSIGLGAGYSSNVYGAQTNKTSDAFFVVQPIVTAASDWSRNRLSVTAQGNLKRFADQTPKNESGYNVTGNGRLDIGSDDRIEGIASAQRAYEEIYSGSFPANAAGSVQYDRYTGLVRGTAVLNRFSLIGSADVNKFDFADTLALAGFRFDQDFRDRVDSRGSARVEYAISPNSAVFVQGSYTHSNYINKSLPGANRSNDETRVIGGITFDLTALVRANVGLGYVDRNYKDAQYSSVKGFAADVQISYFVDGLTTVSLDARRDIQDAIVRGSPGFVSSRIVLRADHELLRNLLPYIEGTYEHDSFQDITRRDNLYQLRGGATYLANRYVKAEPEVNYTHRTSTGTLNGPRFDEVRAMLKVTLQR